MSLPSIPRHSKPQNTQRYVALFLLFAILFLLALFLTLHFLGLIEHPAPIAARTVCAGHYDIFGILRPWHPPLKCYPI